MLELLTTDLLTSRNYLTIDTLVLRIYRYIQTSPATDFTR